MSAPIPPPPNFPAGRPENNRRARHHRNAGSTRPLYQLIGTLGLLVVAYALPLWHLTWFALTDDIFSYILLIPFVSFYFFYLRRNEVPLEGPKAPIASVALAAVGLLTVGSYAWAARAHLQLTEDNQLAWNISGFVFFVWAAILWFSSRQFVRAHLFAVLFLAFIIPLPTWAADQIEAILQHASASAAAVFFHLSGTTFFHEGTYFQLPGIAINVAPECSGIRSSLALFVTSVIAAKVFLRHPLARAVLVAAVLPLAIVRNGFRVFVIGELCVRRGPQMIDSYIHHHGGPIFFILSLIPFAALLWFLIKRQRLSSPTPQPLSI